MESLSAKETARLCLRKEAEKMDHFGAALVLRIYATGISFSGGESSATLLDEEKTMAELVYLVSSLQDLLQDIRIKVEAIESYLVPVAFLCSSLYFFVNRTMYRNSTKLLLALNDAFNLYFSCFRLWRGGKQGYEYRKDMHDVISAAIHLSFSQETVGFIHFVISDVPLQTLDLELLAKTFHSFGTKTTNNERREKVSSVLELCCRRLWSVTFGSDLKKHDEIGNYEDFQKLVGRACDTSCLLLDVVRGDNHKFNRSIIEFINNWFDLRRCFEMLPGPLSLVKKWVEKALENEKEDSETLHSRMLTSISMERKEAEIILEQELLAYEIMGQNLGFKMRTKIMDSLLKIAYAENQYSFQKTRILIKRRALGDDVIDCRKDYIKFLSEAIHNITEHNHSAYSFSHQLAICYSLRALCYLEEKEETKVVFTDIYDAIQLWIKIFFDDPSLSQANKHDIVSETLPLLYHLLDSLSGKGCLEYHHDIYKLIFELEEVSLEDIVARLWEFRRFSHASCCSPINEPFCKILSNLGENWEHADFWKKCFGESKSLLIGFQHELSPYCFETSFGSSPTVKDIASSLLFTDHKRINSISHAAHLYYQLSETLHSRGKLKWALHYAFKAYELRLNLIPIKFAVEKMETKPAFEKYIAYGDLTLSMSVAEEYFSRSPSFWGSKDYILTSSYVLQCYLESILQIGTLHEMLGAEAIATDYLLNGKAISRSQDLPTFEILFSYVLGKIHKKKQDSSMETDEFRIGRQLEQKCEIVTCLKCNVLLKMFTNMQQGDLSSKSDARSCYRRALQKIIFEWGDKSHNEATEIVNCWQGLPSDTVKSKSVSDLMEMKWDYTRRRLGLRILSVQGSSGKEDYFLKSMSLVVGENPFTCTYSSDKLFNLIGMAVPGDFLAIERATLLLNIALFFLKNKRSNCFNQPQITDEKLKSWLSLAFTLSQDVPVLLRKISRLLAGIYFDPKEPVFLVSPCDDPLSANHYTFYYHQASIGTHFENHQLSRMIMQDNLESEMDVEEAGVNIKEKSGAQVNHVANFFKDLPCSPTVCISFFGQESKSLLEEKDGTPPGSTRKRKKSGSNSWMLFSSLYSNKGRIKGRIILFPLHSIPQDNADYDNIFPGGRDGRTGTWTCDWANTTLSKLVPEFKLIMHEIAMDRRPIKESKADAHKEFNKRRRCLDNRLLKLLQGIEDNSFGSLKTSIFGGDEPIFREDEPIVLVLDQEVQMLPWEDMDVLRARSIYRMPTFKSVLRLERSRREHAGYAKGSFFPPKFAFYLINPSGELRYVKELEHWVAEKDMKGIAGERPVREQLVEALESNDLFIYVGHGNVTRFMDISDVINLKDCAACIMLGCSSGATRLNGLCCPINVPFRLLLAGSPFVYGILWTVTERDLTTFAEELLHFLFEKSPTLNGRNGIAEARLRCTLQHLIGGAPVCYGVP